MSGLYNPGPSLLAYMQRWTAQAAAGQGHKGQLSSDDELRGGGPARYMGKGAAGHPLVDRKGMPMIDTVPVSLAVAKLIGGIQASQNASVTYFASEDFPDTATTTGEERKIDPRRHGRPSWAAQKDDQGKPNAYKQDMAYLPIGQLSVSVPYSENYMRQHPKSQGSRFLVAHSKGWANAILDLAQSHPDVANQIKDYCDQALGTRDYDLEKMALSKGHVAAKAGYKSEAGKGAYKAMLMQMAPAIVQKSQNTSGYGFAKNWSAQKLRGARLPRPDDDGKTRQNWQAGPDDAFVSAYGGAGRSCSVRTQAASIFAASKPQYINTTRKHKRGGSFDPALTTYHCAGADYINPDSPRARERAYDQLYANAQQRDAQGDFIFQNSRVPMNSQAAREQYLAAQDRAARHNPVALVDNNGRTEFRPANKYALDKAQAAQLAEQFKGGVNWEGDNIYAGIRAAQFLSQADAQQLQFVDKYSKNAAPVARRPAASAARLQKPNSASSTAAPQSSQFAFGSGGQLGGAGGGGSLFT